MAAAQNTPVCAQSPVSQLTRRTLLAGAPAAVGIAMLPAGGAMALPALAGEVDPLVALWERCRAARAAVKAFKATRDEHEDVPDHLYDALWNVEDEILTTAPATMAGALIVANAMCRDIGLDEPQWWEPSERAAVNLAGFIERMAPRRLRERLGMLA